MARPINRRNFFILDRVLDAIDRSQDFADRTTLRKYEKHQAYQNDTKSQENAKQQARIEDKRAEDLNGKIKALNTHIEALINEIGAIQRKQVELDRLKSNHSS